MGFSHTVVKTLIKNHREACSYYISGNENSFSFEILNKFRFTGYIDEGVLFGSIVLSDILFTDNNSEYIIKFPTVCINGVIENFTIDDMRDYIPHIIELYLEK